MIQLRKITASDTDNIIRWRNNPGVLEYFLDRRTLTRENHEFWLENYVNTGKVEQFIIHNSQDQKDIGSVFLKSVDYEKKNAEFGIFIGEDDQRGKGAGTVATKQIIDYAKDVLHLDSLYLRVLKDNRRAVKAYEKAGFVMDEHQETVVIDGSDAVVSFMTLNLTDKIK